MNNIIYLPISLGEAIDKLTILDIKIDNIHDIRCNDIKKEYNLLYDKLKEFIDKYNDLYFCMKKINLLIWDMMDKLRDGNISDSSYLQICKECIEYNDIRFRIKNKINYVSGSFLKEQKGYKKNILQIIINDEQNFQNFIKPIKYYSFLYDEIIIIYDGKSSTLKDYFYYDPTIHIYNFTEKNITCEVKKTIYFTKKEDNINDISILFEIDNDKLYNFFL